MHGGAERTTTPYIDVGEQPQEIKKRCQVFMTLLCMNYCYEISHSVNVLLSDHQNIKKKAICSSLELSIKIG